MFELRLLCPQERIEAVGEALRKAARDVESKEDMAAVATVSSRDGSGRT